MCDDLLLYNTRIVVPKALQSDTLWMILQGHQGIRRCRQRVLALLWRSGVSCEIEQYVISRPQFVKSSNLVHEPLLSHYSWSPTGKSSCWSLWAKGKHLFTTGWLLLQIYWSAKADINYSSKDDHSSESNVCPSRHTISPGEWQQTTTCVTGDEGVCWVVQFFTHHQ